MPRRRREAKLHVGDLSHAELDRMTYAQQCRLVERGLITNADVAASTQRQVLAMNGGVDPYGHLRQLDDELPGLTAIPYRRMNGAPHDD